MLGLRPELEWFVQYQEYVLDQHKDKDEAGGWSGCRNEFLFNCILHEVQELYEVLHYPRPSSSIKRECADIANFCMMIAANNTRIGE